MAAAAPVGPVAPVALATRGPRGVWWRSASGDRGAGTVLALGLVGGVMALTLTVAALVGVVTARGVAQSAADLSALAAAAAVQRGDDDPCLRSTRVAARNETQLLRCGCDADRSCSVEVRRETGLGPDAVASARAGPTSARPDG